MHNARSNRHRLCSSVCDRMAQPFANRAEQAVSFIDLIVMCRMAHRSMPLLQAIHQIHSKQSVHYMYVINGFDLQHLICNLRINSFSNVF